jgi:hypothetical protein
LSKSRRSTGAGAEKFEAYSEDAITGKSSRGSVASWKCERPASTVSRPVAPSSAAHKRAIGQLAHDFVQGDGADGGGAGAGHLRGGPVDHLDVEIGGAETHLLSLRLDQHVGEDRDGVAALDDRLRLADTPSGACRARC